MIIVKIQGGLGNQISQYAFSRLLASIYPEQEIKWDTNWLIYNSYNIRTLELLEKFQEEKLIYAYATQKEIIKATKQIPTKVLNPTPAIKAVNKISRIIQNTLRCNKYVTQTLLSGYPVVEDIYNLDTTKNWYFDGFWPNFDYSSIMPQLREELTFKLLNRDANQEWIDKIQSTESVSIHVRMGDYKNSVFEVTTPNYYVKAMQLIKSKVTNSENIKFFIFSDESDIVAEWLGLQGDNYEIVNVNSGQYNYMDMHLMSICKHNIITNSTFSYWAAQLNKNSEKIVTRPKMQNQDRETWQVPGWIILDI